MKNKKLGLALAVAFIATGVFAATQGAGPEPYPNFGLARVQEMMNLVLQLGVILFAARVGGAVASWLKLPSILGELAAGIVIGPWALGGIGFLPDYFHGVFADGLFHGAALREMAAAGHTFDATSPALYGIATLASIILLFLSGLETNLKMFLRYSFVGSMVGIGGVVVSFLFGDLCAVWLLPKYFPHFASLASMPLAEAVTSPAPMFLGIMSTATSVGITARILSEKKKMDSEEGTTIMAGAVIDDVLGLIVLAIGTGIIAANQAAAASGGAAQMDWGNVGLVAAKAFGVWIGATIVGVLSARYIAKFLKVCFKSPVVIATMAFGLAMIIAGLFELAGLAMIIGAYVMGLALSRTDLKHPIQEMLTPVYTFLVPVFFCAMGMMVDVTALFSKPVLIFGAIYTVLAVIAKIVGCMIPSMCCGFNVLGGLRVGAGMVPRGEVALIVAGLALSGGYLTQEMFGVGILMTLITTVVAPPVLVALFTPKKNGMRHPKPSNVGSREVTFSLPSDEIATLVMTKILAEFHHEGFFTTCLSQQDHIWEVAMDEIELSVRREGAKIHFSCTPAEEAMVMTAWMEVASQMNDLARTIANPIRKEDVDRMFQESEAVKRGHEGVSRYLQGFVMLPNFRATTKQEAIEQMVAEIGKACPNHVSNVAAATAAVLKREASMPTGLDRGIAVPHGRDASVRGIAGAVAIVDNSNGGCLSDYETIDKSQVRIIVLTVANDQAQTPYLKLMSYISRALRADHGADRLAACQTADEMRKFFRRTK